jgi:hypothetical protein
MKWGKLYNESDENDAQIAERLGPLPKKLAPRARRSRWPGC